MTIIYYLMLQLGSDNQQSVCLSFLLNISQLYRNFGGAVI